MGLGLIRTTHSQPGSRLSIKSPQGNGSAEAIVEDLPIAFRN